MQIVAPKDKSAYTYIEYLTGKRSSLTTIPLRVVDSRSKIRTFTEELNELLYNDISKFDTDYEREDFEFFGYIISELLNNAIDHGESPAVVFAQLFPQIRELEIGVVDSGLGFYKTIKRRYDIKTEAEAINLALKKGVSGAQAYLYSNITKNVGYGLYVISKMVHNSGGDLIIVSGQAVYLNNKFFTLKKSWEGSIITIRLKLKEFYQRIVSLGFIQFFQMLLAEDIHEEFDEDFL